MHNKIFLLSISLSLLLFTSCANKSIKKKPSPKQENKTIKESSFIGKLLVGTLTLLGTKGNIGKALQASEFGGNASGYFVGKKLSDMQKNYKEKEEELITNILKIDEEATLLKEKNDQLLVELLDMQEKIVVLAENKILKQQEKLDKKILIKQKLQKKKNNLNLLLKQNKEMSQKIAFSKTKVNEYAYTQEDKKEILNSVNFLEKNSKEYALAINKNINTLTQMISTL